MVAINKRLRGFYAKSLDKASVQVKIPVKYQNEQVKFISLLERVSVFVDTEAVVVVNQRTGTVVLGGAVTVSPVTISHGTLSVKVKDENNVDESTFSDQSIVKVPTATVSDLVESLNALGVKPVDLVAIIQAMHAAGAVNGELRFI